MIAFIHASKFTIPNIFTTALHDILPCSITYHSLHHEDSLFSQFTDLLVNIDGLLCLDLLQHVVQGDEGASPAHTSTTVHQQQILPGVGVCLSHSLDEVDHGVALAGTP